MTVVDRNAIQGIESNRVVQVSRVKVNEIVGSSRWNMIEQFLGQITVGIDQADAVAGGDVLHDQIPEQRSFSRACFSDHINVVTAIRRGDAEKRGLAAPTLSISNVVCLFLHGAEVSRYSQSRSRRWRVDAYSI